ncbi:MAG: hypothetical protein EZS28_000072 [Streblomastix strix]|uniref:Uncharacterized protein n=1 Tax=Streblomastix strix TaxID=222440 RepID=A0A5J4XBC1_9EUKA|nr:MAG: hypothetical protein EZS28_000072 [Streblomastix strix]
MDFQHALKNLIESGTNIECFDNEYVIQINKDIRNKLLFQARGGGIAIGDRSDVNPKKKVQKQPQKQIEDDDFTSFERQDEQIECDDDSISEVREKPLKKQVSNRIAAEGRKRVVKTSKTPQINYTNPQLDLEELIRNMLLNNVTQFI